MCQSTSYWVLLIFKIKLWSISVSTRKRIRRYTPQQRNTLIHSEVLTVKSSPYTSKEKDNKRETISRSLISHLIQNTWLSENAGLSQHRLFSFQPKYIPWPWPSNVPRNSPIPSLFWYLHYYLTHNSWWIFFLSFQLWGTEL